MAGGVYQPSCTAGWNVLTLLPSIFAALVMCDTSLFPSSLVVFEFSIGLKEIVEGR